MAAPELDLESLSVDDRLRLIDELWLSIAIAAGRGDEKASEALDATFDIEPELLAELEQCADELERDPSKGIPWEDIVAELRRKHG